MFRNRWTAAVAFAGIAVSAPALAGPHGGGNGVGAGATMNSQGSLNASPTGIQNSSVDSALKFNSTTAPNVRAPNSQGLAHASPNGIAHASPNSVLARGSVSSATLPGLTTGLSVQNSTGASIGTVSRVITGTDGSIRAVVVTSPTGRTYTLAANSLTISGNLVTTTSTMRR